MSEELSGDSSNRLSSIMDLDYEAPEEAIDNKVEPDDTKPAPSNEQPKEKAKAKQPKADKDDAAEPEEESEEESEEEEKVESDKKKLKYKVDGEEIEEEFSDEDLAAAVSAKKASLKKINEVNIERKKYQAENASMKEEVEYVKNEMIGLRGDFEKDIESFRKNGVVSGNPLSPIYNLLDKMGLDTASFDKAALYYFLPMAEKFSALSDEGRDLFLSKHENEWHKRKQSSLEKQKTQIAEQRRKFEEDSSELRKANLSTEQAQELKDELSQMGVKELTTKKVIEWNQLKPSYLRAQDIEKKVPGTNVNKIARIFIEFPDTTDQEILEKLGYKEIEKENVSRKLAESIPKKNVPKKKSDDKVDEEVDRMFNKMFRR
jgi:hypothetical protein